MESLTELRRAALQEIINISFGRASASLSDLLNVFVGMTVPYVQEISQKQIFIEIEERVGANKDVTIVQQVIKGGFNGEILLAIPADAGMKAINMLGQEGGFAPSLPSSELEMEVFLEIGNIVIGACMGQFAELLDTSVSYEVPTILLDKSSVTKLRADDYRENEKAIIVRTEFQLGDKALTGFLFILFDQRWFDTLCLELDKFIENMT